MIKAVNLDYIAQAKKLNADQRERVLSRMVGKLPKRLQKEKLSADEAIAIQLELEDEQLQDWRKNMAEIQAKAAKAKAKADEKAAKSAKKAEPKAAPVAKTAPAKKATPVKKATVKVEAKPAATTAKTPVSK